MTTKPEARLQELGLTLPTPPKPVAKYKMAVLAAACCTCPATAPPHQRQDAGDRAASAAS